MESIRLLANSSRVFADKTIDGLIADVERNRAFAESSPSIVTPLNRIIGYETAAKVAKHSVEHGEIGRASCRERVESAVDVDREAQIHHDDEDAAEMAQTKK